MFAAMASYFRKPLEYAGLLSEREPEMTELEAKVVRRLEEFFREEIHLYQERKGHVTQRMNDVVELNHRWIYELGQNDNFAVGDYVSWKEYKASTGTEIKDVILVNDKAKFVKKRIVSAKIMQIDGPKCTTNCGVIFYRDKVRCVQGFRPFLSDFVDLECTYITNEPDKEESDPDPSSLQVERVVPYDTQNVNGKITHWDPSTFSGVVKDHMNPRLTAIFHQAEGDQLMPTLGASVAGKCVKGEYEGGFCWRAYEMTKNTGSARASSKPHFFFVKPIQEFEVILGETETVELCVTNNSERSCTVESVRFSICRTNRAIQVDHEIKLPYPIPPQSDVSWPVHFRGDKLGSHKLNVIWKIAGKDSPIRTHIAYRTVEKCSGEPEKKSRVRQRASFVFPAGRRGKPIYNKVPMRSYPVPDRLREICADSSGLSLIEIQIALNGEYPILGEYLTPANYKEHMHLMLYMEEIAQEKSYERLATRGSLLRGKDCATFSFPADSEYTKLVAGDKVRASKPWEKVEYEASIRAIYPTSVSLKFSDLFESSFPSGAQFDLRFVMNRNTNKRRHHAIDVVIQNLGASWLLPNEHAVDDQDPEALSINWYNSDLNREQKSAVRNILAKRNLPYPYIIYGPPGTGKTVTVVEAILQIITHQSKHSDFRILVAAPTNSAVDTLGLRLLEFGVFDKTEMVRLSSYNAYSSGHIAAGLVDIAMVPHLGDPAHDAPLSTEDENTPVLYLNDLSKFRIVIGTLSTISILNCVGFEKGFFTHVITDEAGQCHVPDTLLAIALVEPNKTQLVLAGDPQQLGPTISSNIAKQYGFHESFLDRLTNAYLYRKSQDAFRDTHGYNPALITKLVNNYRSLPKIVDLVGSIFYAGDLRPTISEAHSREAEVLRKLTIHRLVLKENMDSMIFINVNTPEEQVEGNMSWMNHGEVAQVFFMLNYLYEAKVSPDDIGIITPYALQKKKIYEYLDAMGAVSPKVASVEEFQGQERDVMILSLVRNNLGISHRLSPFVTDPHRINVAMSRARVLNIIIGNHNTLRADTSQLWPSILKKCHIINLATANRERLDKQVQPPTSFPDPD